MNIFEGLLISLYAFFICTLVFPRSKTKHKNVLVVKSEPVAPKVLDADWHKVWDMEKYCYVAPWPHAQHPDLAKTELGKKHLIGAGPPGWWEKQRQSELAKLELDAKLEAVVAAAEALRAQDEKIVQTVLSDFMSLGKAGMLPAAVGTAFLSGAGALTADSIDDDWLSYPRYSDDGI
jgi:hypothetical protein